jgi:hypothetical protein
MKHDVFIKKRLISGDAGTDLDILEQIWRCRMRSGDTKTDLCGCKGGS